MKLLTAPLASGVQMTAAGPERPGGDAAEGPVTRVASAGPRPDRDFASWSTLPRLT